MAISASDVKKLRDLTGAGMMDCKKALTEADGDFQAAEKILKEMGLAAVAKRQDRATENGRVFVSCETDFVAKNADFAKLGEDMCDVILAKGYTEINDELRGMVDGLIAIIKENMNIVKFDLVPVASYASTYIHGEGAVAVCVNLESDKKEIFENEDVKELAHDLALHVAAFKPQYLDDASVSKEFEAEQLSIFKAQVDSDEKLSSKPDKVKEGIIRGKLSKLYKEICFLDQAFVKDDSKSVSQAIGDVAKKYQAQIKVVGYVVYQAGVTA